MAKWECRGHRRERASVRGKAKVLEKKVFMTNPDRSFFTALAARNVYVGKLKSGKPTVIAESGAEK
jgi:hypothetical protein